MNYESVKKTLKIFTFIFSVAAVFSLGVGFDKMHNYVSADSYREEPHNAYVGGDAYNYIINGTYAGAYFSLSAGFLVSSTLCFLGGYIIEALEDADRKRKDSNDELIKAIKDSNISKSPEQLFDNRLPEL